MMALLVRCGDCGRRVPAVRGLGGVPSTPRCADCRGTMDAGAAWT